MLGQSYSEIEYIVIDGASGDDTVKIAAEYKDKFLAKGYKYVVVSEPDKGMYDALNKGAGLATGELVGQINSDDWYEPDAVAIGVLRILEAVRLCGLAKTCCIYQASTAGRKIKEKSRKQDIYEYNYILSQP